ncbi:type I restriction endonuclease subunit R [Dapis sp. BLCC M126]|uniref:type I restriction endonuclease subunit R n=1 Tax=Dapis sp. BLCC M126 TaxID=3400189 RepID=UPI003CF839B5
MTPDITEKNLENIIYQSLIQDSQYSPGNSADYHRTYCLDISKLSQFLHSTQPEKLTEISNYYGTNWETKLYERLHRQIQEKSIVNILRQGIKAGETRLELYYKLPTSRLNRDTIQNYQKNIFSVTRQLKYKENHNLALDLVIFINGLPVITFELKNQLTGQNFQDAINQYKNDRHPRELLFQLKRCLVHFALDTNEVWMTTKLDGKNTKFLPFNKGKKSNSALLFPDTAGNPPNPNGIKTDYLWKEILAKETFSNIIENYAQLTEEENKDRDKKSAKKQKLIFPRYHQLDLVRQLLKDTKNRGVGNRYLIQHSAGSGKSNSITWLSHQLVELKNITETEKVFDSVLVVTDRKILDKQIRENIKQFAQVAGVVEAITEGSKQLKSALEKGSKIIITTVQKFPYIVEEIQSLADQKFAIIIDEAHSSQTGKSAAKMTESLSKEDSEAEETTEDKIIRIIESQKPCQNANYYAFTATPKNQTLELFGVKNPADGKFYPFHSYSMKQAIAEGFILDVLQNYTTYKTYCRLQKKIIDDPEFDIKQAKKRLKKYVESHPESIAKKAEVMIEHFLLQVISQGKINGKAKAMVVSNSIKSAIYYKLAFDEYLRKINSEYQTIVAFSGSKEIDGKKEDEYSMNGFSGSKITEIFKEDKYRFLIVANKYQTGFDEPLLNTMYVDKILSDVKAVQTLSRLNRSCDGKNDTFVLDFVNSADEIQRAFEPYYKTTILSEETDSDRLHDLEDSLANFQIYSSEDVQEFMTRFLSSESRENWESVLDSCVENYQNNLQEEEKIDFQNKGRSFVRNYQFLVQVKSFKNSYWESLNAFLKLLVNKLPKLDNYDSSAGIINSVDIESYRIELLGSQSISLSRENTLSPVAENIVRGNSENKSDKISQIIQEFNNRFGGSIAWQNEDKVWKFLLEELPEKVRKDGEYQNARNYSDPQNAKLTFENKFHQELRRFIREHIEEYRQFTDNKNFREWLINTLFNLDYGRDKIA